MPHKPPTSRGTSAHISSSVLRPASTAACDAFVPQRDSVLFTPETTGIQLHGNLDAVKREWPGQRGTVGLLATLQTAQNHA